MISGLHTEYGALSSRRETYLRGAPGGGRLGLRLRLPGVGERSAPVPARRGRLAGGPRRSADPPAVARGLRRLGDRHGPALPGHAHGTLPNLVRTRRRASRLCAVQGIRVLRLAGVAEGP